MGSDHHTIIALIPAYQPDKNLELLVRDLNMKKFKIVVVDDGSGKKYSDIFRNISKKAVVLSYPQNHGKGYALKKGLRYINSRYNKDFTVVTLDADGQHKVSDAARIAHKSVINKDCLILGSRKITGNVPFKSKFGNTVTRFVFKKKTGTYIYDTQTGLRAFSSNLMNYMINIDGSGYEYEMNVLMKCAYDTIPVIEENISTIYLSDNKSSHFNPIKDSYKIYRSIFKFKHNPGGKKKC